jgi:hypothetical protein
MISRLPSFVFIRKLFLQISELLLANAYAQIMQIRLLLGKLLLAHLHPRLILFSFHLFIYCLLTLKTGLADQFSSFLQPHGINSVMTRRRFSTLKLLHFFATKFI